MSLNATFVQNFVKQNYPSTSIYLAYSGGLDSTVLLHLLKNTQLPFQAVHVNHHLQAQANAWENFCKEKCQQLQIPCMVMHADIDQSQKQSVEEAARNERYRLLESLLDESTILVTAHHKNDVVETMLLNLIRGSGSMGLAAIPQEKKLGKGKLVRPLLNFTREELNEYAHKEDLQWIEDTSNQNLNFDRNYIRHKILPSILERWPSALQTIARAAELQVNTVECLTELAVQDLQFVKTTDDSKLNIYKLKKLSTVRLNNALRVWIQQHNMRVPSKKLLEQIVEDIITPKDMETSPVQCWEDGEIRRYRDELFLLQPLSKHDPKQEITWTLNQPLYIKSLDQTLDVKELKQHGVMLPDSAQQLVVKFRSGGEQLKPIGKNHHRSLKNLFQESDIPPWKRDRIPLLYLDNRLISVYGYWNAAIERET